MTMTPALRRFALTAHVTFSVGWIGAAAAFLALAVVAFTNDDAQTVRGAYLVMEPAAWGALVPLAIATLVSGLVMSLGTAWGLFRHYWVVLKLVITTFCTIILLIYMGTFASMAAAANDPTLVLTAVQNPSPIVHAILALLLLLTANVLAIYKPLGLTSYGARMQVEGGARRPVVDETAARLNRYVMPALIGFLAFVVLWHLLSGGAHGH